jgi:predicted transcriptional regulator
MPSRVEYDETLTRLADLLRERPMTARAIAAEFKCSKPVAYARLRDLVQRGHKLKTSRVRESTRGPQSLAYELRRGRA